jgi:hypothetical protein
LFITNNIILFHVCAQNSVDPIYCFSRTIVVSNLTTIYEQQMLLLLMKHPSKTDIIGHILEVVNSAGVNVLMD